MDLEKLQGEIALICADLDELDGAPFGEIDERLDKITDRANHAYRIAVACRQKEAP